MDSKEFMFFKLFYAVNAITMVFGREFEWRRA